MTGIIIRPYLGRLLIIAVLVLGAIPGSNVFEPATTAHAVVIQPLAPAIKLQQHRSAASIQPLASATKHTKRSFTKTQYKCSDVLIGNSIALP